jgi:hypothetical protein
MWHSELGQPSEVARSASGNVNGAAATSLDFGPVIERTLCPSDLEHEAYLALDSGKSFDAPDPHKVKGGTVASDADVWKWAASNGIDLSFDNGTKWPASAGTRPSGLTYLIVIDMAVAASKSREDGGDWDCPPPEKAAWFGETKPATMGNSYYFGFKRNETVWFKTRGGKVGLLQFLGYAVASDSSHGVKIRYKLVKE